MVVGATGGLGSPIADELRKRGATVIGAGRTGPDVVIDIRDSRAGGVLVREVTERQGRIDVVVVASGIVAFGDLVATDDVAIEELFLVNVLGPLWLARAVLPALAETKGSFGAITGVVSEQALPGMVPYGASKAALSHALSGLRREARRVGVHIADFRPPHTETGLAGRPLSGVAPTFRPGLEPSVVARRIVTAIESDEAEVPASGFAA